MRNDGQKPTGFIPTSFRALSSYLRVVSSGASTVASSVRSAASGIVERDSDAGHDQVVWAGFDKLECDGGITRQVLLLGYKSGFQVWDVEEADNVHDRVSRLDGPVSFLQMLPKPIVSKSSGDKFSDSRPLLAICVDGSLSGVHDTIATPCNGSTPNCHDPVNGGVTTTVVSFFSLRSQSYVHVLKFRSVVYSVRCSTQVVAVLQASQIQCFDAATLERECTIITNPIVAGCSGFGGMGYGPLAVGPRWLAYSGSPVAVSNSGHVNPHHLIPSSSCSVSHGSLVAQYAKESSKQLATGIVTLGDMGYKKLYGYYSELLPDGNDSAQSGSLGGKANGIVNGNLPDAENVGMVIVRDMVSLSVITQFRAHKSPISSLCFDPSGTLLVTASVQGHNINVFQIMRGVSGSSSRSDSGPSYVHLYRLQRGFTNAVIQDISFSRDSRWIMISSSRGTSHLFSLFPSWGSVNFQSSDACSIGNKCGSGVMTKPSVRWPPSSGSQMLNQCAFGPPVSLSVVSRIRSGNNGWRSTVSGAAAAATGRMSSLSGAIASVFHNCTSNDLNAKDQLLVFSPSGCMVQYGLVSSHDSTPESDARLLVEAIQKWNICQKQSRREQGDNIDIYGDNGNSDSSKIYPLGIERDCGGYPEARGSVVKVKTNGEEANHLFISEAELQIHQARILLWAKPKIYFQSMTINDKKIDGEEGDSGGEIEIEKIPTRMIEARSKDLVPVSEYLQTPKFQQARTPALDSDTSGNEVTKRESPHLPTGTTRGTVNNNESPKSNTQLGIVNSTESSMAEEQINFVNDNIEGLKMEDQLKDDGDEFD